MKWPDDFSWKHKAIVYGPTILGFITSVILIGAAVKMIQVKALTIFTAIYLIFLLMLATFIGFWGYSITGEWRQNLEEDLGGENQ